MSHNGRAHKTTGNTPEASGSSDEGTLGYRVAQDLFFIRYYFQDQET